MELNMYVIPKTKDTMYDTKYPKIGGGNVMLWGFSCKRLYK